MARYKQVKQFGPQYISATAPKPVIGQTMEEEDVMQRWEKEMREKWGFDDDFIQTFKAVRSASSYRRYCEALGMEQAPGA